MSAATRAGHVTQASRSSRASLVEPMRIAASCDIARFRNVPPALVEAVADAVPDGTEGQDDAATTLDNADPAITGDPAPNPDPEPEAAPAAPAHPSLEPASIRAEAIAHARAVIDLCRLAGQPQMAGRFLEQDASLDAVRAKLLAAKAEAEPDISAHHPQPGPGPSARPWGDVIARTFKSKG